MTTHSWQFGVLISILVLAVAGLGWFIFSQLRPARRRQVQVPAGAEGEKGKEAEGALPKPERSEMELTTARVRPWMSPFRAMILTVVSNIGLFVALEAAAHRILGWIARANFELRRWSILDAAWVTTNPATGQPETHHAGFDPMVFSVALLVMGVWLALRSAPNMYQIWRKTSWKNDKPQPAFIRLPEKWMTDLEKAHFHYYGFGAVFIWSALTFAWPEFAKWFTDNPHAFGIFPALLGTYLLKKKKGLGFVGWIPYVGVLVATFVVVMRALAENEDAPVRIWGLTDLAYKVSPPQNNPAAAGWTATAQDSTAVAEFNANKATKAYIILPGQMVWLGQKEEFDRSGKIAGAVDFGYWIEGEFYLADRIMDPLVELHLVRGSVRVILPGWRNLQRIRELVGSPTIVDAADTRLRLGLKGREAVGHNHFSTWTDIEAQVEKKYGIQNWMVDPGGIDVGICNKSDVAIRVHMVRLYHGRT